MAAMTATSTDIRSTPGAHRPQRDDQGMALLADLARIPDDDPRHAAVRDQAASPRCTCPGCSPGR